MKQLLTIVILACTVISAQAQKGPDGIWGVKLGTSLSTAESQIKTNKGYTAEWTTENKISYTGAEFLDTKAERATLKFEDGKLSGYTITYPAGDIQNALKTIDALYTNMVKTYGLPDDEKQSTEPLSVQQKNNKDYPYFTKVLFYDNSITGIRISKEFEVLVFLMLPRE